MYSLPTMDDDDDDASAYGLDKIQSEIPLLPLAAKFSGPRPATPPSRHSGFPSTWGHSAIQDIGSITGTSLSFESGRPNCVFLASSIYKED
jgi:hypothetical protein